MSTLITPTSPKAFGMDVLGLAPENTIPASILIQATTRLGVVEGDSPYVRVPFIDLDEDAGFVPEGNAIPEAEPDLSEIVLATGKIAALVRISREQMSQEAVSDITRREIERAVSKKVDWVTLQQPKPTAPSVFPPAGLLVNAYDGGQIADSLDALIDAVAHVETSTGGNASHIIVDPLAWASLAKLKTADNSNVSLIGAGTSAPQRSLLGLPVIVTNAMPANGVLVLDKSKTLSAYGSIDVAVSKDVYFSSDSLGVRATFRFGVGFSKPGAGVKLSVA